MRFHTKNGSLLSSTSYLQTNTKKKRYGAFYLEMVLILNLLFS